jgi:hypothetical protein
MSVGNTMFMSDYYRTVYKFSKSSNTPIPNDHSNQLVLTFDAKGDHNFPFLFELEYGSLLGSGVFGDYYHEAPSGSDPYYEVLSTSPSNSSYDQTTGLLTYYINLDNSDDIVNKALLGIRLEIPRTFSFPVKLRLREVITKNYNGNQQTIIRDNPNLMSDYLVLDWLEPVPPLIGLCTQEPSLYNVFIREPGTDVWNNYGSTVCLSSTSFKVEQLDGQAYNAYAVDRTKNVKLAADIEKGKRNSWSMGCDATRIFCSYCGQTQATVDDHGNVIGGCTHIDPNAGVVFYELNGKIVCRAASGLSGVELSSVGTPAFMMAVNNVNSIKGYS